VITPFFDFGDPQYYNPYLVAILAQADAVFACTPLEKAKLTEIGVKPNRISVVPMGVDPNEWKNADGRRFRKKNGIPETKFIVFYAGTKAYNKGAIHLLKAMSLVQQKRNDVILVAAGFSSREWLAEKRRMRELKLIDLDYITGQEKYDAFDACDVFVMPSRCDLFGIVYLEAWICGEPVIGAKACATSEVILDGVDGLLVEFGDVHELSQKILYLIENPHLRQKFGSHGRKRTLANYTWPLVIKHVQNVYQHIT
jgi:glycosyltransferase involved in cell wall biosynthesis